MKISQAEISDDLCPTLRKGSIKAWKYLCVYKGLNKKNPQCNELQMPLSF